MANADTTKTRRLPGGLSYDPELSAGNLFDDGFALLATATEQIKQTADRLFNSDDEEENNLSAALYGSVWLVELSHDMLFGASEKRYNEEVKP
ncbi:hypothetical protein IMCC21906_00017 [Spongiibacter sp. IMCC21906]|uniref:hypothetical protein n=1 Tax=Spongiibacter sp. IMCC21906 TaxID=1620392 RepID=UPI00062E0717|nr:hypothetical protein [Spongiibacter sp. IMCC21906]AKH67712.1 hypothetical protein IMCC21906_00017 [Spongiibacter sp. IMCC21906]